MPSIEYLTTFELDRLWSHKYKCSGSSITEKWMQKFWCFTVNFLPLWLAPNLITLTGLIFTIISTVIMLIYSLHATSTIPSWTLLLSAVCLFLYQTLDAIDGKQARRTGTSTPLGELFDHGCDAIATVIYPIGIVITLRLGTEPLVAFAIVFSAIILFYTYHWSVYVKDVLECGKIDVTESQLVIMAVYVTTAYFGQSIWTDVLLFGLSLRMYFFVFILIVSWQIILGKISIIFKGGVGRNGSSIAETSVISPMIPIFLSVVSSFYVVTLYDDFFTANPVLLILLLSISPMKQATDIILRRMTRSPLNMVDSSLLTQLILLLNANLSRPLKVELLFVITGMYAVWDYCIYVYSVCYQISSFLGISVLLISPLSHNH